MIQPLWKTVWRSYDPENPLLGIYPKKTKIEKDTCIPLFSEALFTIARTWEPPRCPSTDEWIKESGIYTQWNITQLLKRMHLSQF